MPKLNIHQKIAMICSGLLLVMLPAFLVWYLDGQIHGFVLITVIAYLCWAIPKQLGWFRQ